METRPPAIFINESVGLDFLNSIATPVDTAIDWIDSGEGLLTWLAQAKLLPADVLESIRQQALPGELDKVANRARDLREWFRGFLRKHMGSPLAKKDLRELEPLNRLMERDEAFNRIVIDPGKEGSVLRLQLMRRWRSPEALLLPIGEEVARFICTADFSELKACEGMACTLIFADHTRGHKRRWCSMAICGNRAKQSAHRKRSKDQE